jgi:serine protease Do
VSILFLGAQGLAAVDDLEAIEEQAMKTAVAQVAASVLRIETVGGVEHVGRVLVGTGPTTGLAVSEDGYVVSSAFNFIQQPSSILVTLPSGKRAAAQIVAHDRSRMLVLLKVHTDQRLVVPPAVPRSEMVVGQWTIAVGRTFEGEQPNLSVGILSALNRIWGKAIQTDAKISPNNYGGPLIDIRGRVLGVLVPLSPQAQDEVAGAEWYDSGIGFAIPLAEILPYLNALKQGRDLKPGILGVVLKGDDMFADPADLAACQPKSPAQKAGLKSGDRIVEVEGLPIARQVQLRHALGRRYAGEKVRLVALRGQQRMEINVELTDHLEPYEHPFVGLLPLREPLQTPGLAVRYVYPGSPAAEAGLQPGDRLVKLESKPLATVADAWEVLGNYEPQQKVKLTIERQGQPHEVELTLAALPTTIPAALPAARTSPPAADTPRPAVGEVPIVIPEDDHECFAYVPETYRADVAHGVILWLPAPGEFDKKNLVGHWKTHCERHDLILLAPRAADPKRWLPTEVPYIRKTLDDLLAKYNIDRTRIVTHGYQGGGGLAYLIAFLHQDLVRGVAAVDAPLPARAHAPATDPIRRQAFHLTYGQSSKQAAAVGEGVKQLQERKYPVTVHVVDGEGRYLNDSELAELVRWIDTLDRL